MIILHGEDYETFRGELKDVVRRTLTISRLDQGRPRFPAPFRGCLSIGIGALSHVIFDLITHGNFHLLWPWYGNDHAFPSWWYHSWGEIPLPFYREPYPFAPHTISWILMTVLGAVLFFRCLRK